MSLYFLSFGLYFFWKKRVLLRRFFPAWSLFVNRQSLWHTNLASKGFTLHRPQGLEAFETYKTISAPQKLLVIKTHRHKEGIWGGGRGRGEKANELLDASDSRIRKCMIKLIAVSLATSWGVISVSHTHTHPHPHTMFDVQGLHISPLQSSKSIS